MKKKSLLITAIAIFCFTIISMAQTVPSYVPTSGLVGWWPFTGNANDLSVNANNGTLVGGTVLTTDRFGSLNSAYAFDGNADYIDCGNAPSVNITGSLTISAWIYASDLSTTRGIVTKSPLPPVDDAYQLVVGAYVLSDLNFLNSDYGYLVPTLSWVHVASVFDSVSQTISLYTNGLLDTTINVAFSSIGTSSDNLCLGTHRPAFTTNWSWSGNLDDIGIWNRALDSCEIKDLYFARPGSCCYISVSTQPVSQSANISNTAQFTIASSDSSATYQWQSDLGIGFQNINSVGQYSGTTNDTLSVSSVTMGNNNQPFRCIVSSGACSDTSSAAVLTVINANGINKTATNNLFTVYPNPAKSQINVKVDATLIGASYAIYDNIGKMTLTGKINAENTVIELGSLSGGIYLFSIGDNLKQMFTVVKE
ncbi:MAG: LamG-like jellyroll fold domain-containing protein [Bacteroidota bacterium]